MPNLVMAEKNGRIYPTHPVQAQKDGATVLEESPYRDDGRIKDARRSNGRRAKPKTTVDQAAEKKKLADSSAQTAEEGQS